MSESIEKQEKLNNNGVEAAQVERLVMPDYDLLCNDFTEIIMYQLHSFEQMDKTGEVQFADLRAPKEEVIKRYQNDFIFNNRVQSTVALLMRSIQEEHDNRMAGLPFERFRIVEA